MSDAAINPACAHEWVKLCKPPAHAPLSLLVPDYCCLCGAVRGVHVRASEEIAKVRSVNAELHREVHQQRGEIERLRSLLREARARDVPR